ncbi:MAG: M4 family metallopeptidase [Thermoleophilia bacterium]|nr:M4 family metallopeptidase [Thermoleophilia bacterium]
MNHILGQKGTGEAGAVNESLADTFAAAVDQKNWKIGEDIRPGGIRTMDTKETKSFELPDAGAVTVPINMADYVDTHYDKGGVHINVGIPNKAASLIGDKIGRDNMAALYLDAVRKFMPQSGNGGIADLAKATMLASKERFGDSSKESQAVVDAWTSVGVLGGAAQTERQPRERQRLTNIDLPFVTFGAV